ncbi:hypothetical protein SUGI_0832880 [Cryptomeria japonica]|nr:hypothetical protein SUGI_0832880 [Cryptomeria japonica]
MLVTWAVCLPTQQGYKLMDELISEDFKGQLTAQKVGEVEVENSSKAALDYAQFNYYIAKKKVADLKALEEENLRMRKETMDLKATLVRKDEIIKMMEHHLKLHRNLSHCLQFRPPSTAKVGPSTVPTPTALHEGLKKKTK